MNAGTIFEPYQREVLSKRGARSGVASAIEVESASGRINVEIDVLTVLLGARHQLKLRSTPELGQQRSILAVVNTSSPPDVVGGPSNLRGD